jgi:xylose isomerase
MMTIKHSLMVGMMGKVSDRFHEYQSAQDLRRRLELARKVTVADGIEIVYPSEFANRPEAIKIIRDSGFTLSAVNLNVKGEKRWQTGSFTSSDPEIRRQAVAEMKIAMDLAVELGTDMISCCPLIDGHNYSFEVDYLKQWNWLKEGLSEAAKHRSDVRVSLEYKLNESRNFNVLSDMGRALHLCDELNLPHVGVTMDVGHALIAKETPAESLSLAALANRLYYVHFNDNAREWDWDMMPGSVNIWDLVEVMFYLRRLKWDGWFSYDVIVRDGEMAEAMQTSIEIVKTADQLVDKIGMDKMEAMLQEGIPARAFSQLFKALL